MKQQLTTQLTDSTVLLSQWVFKPEGSDATNYYNTIKNKHNSLWICTDGDGDTNSPVYTQSVSWNWAVNPVPGLPNVYK